jgi:hypothetical protein
VRKLSDTQVYALSLQAPALARRRLIEYRDALERQLFDDVCIVTSELVSNAVIHSGKAEGDPITVNTTLAANVLRIEVIDYADVVPVLRPAHERRSGLAYVATVSDRWAGSTTTPFSVWAEIDVHTNGLVRRPHKPADVGAAPDAMTTGTSPAAMARSLRALSNAGRPVTRIARLCYSES